MNLKYITYCRKSSEDKDRQVLSIQSQFDELDSFARNNELDIFCTRDESQSAAKQGRRVFDEVMNMIESGQANALLVWKFDRISRNEIDTARVIKAFRDGVLEEIRTPFETYRKGDNVLLLYVFFGLADEYSRQLSANVKRGMRTKLRLGQYPGRAPFGYRNYNENNVKNIKPDKDAEIVRMIFKWYASGEYSLGQIKRKLNTEMSIKSKLGGRFSNSELQKILKNKTYYGIIERGGEVYSGSFEPLITKDLFDKTQIVMSNKSRPRGKKDLQHAYKMLIRCAECDSIYTACTKYKYYKKTDRHAYYTYYFCAKKHGICSQKPIKESELEKQFIEALTEVPFDEEEWRIAVDLLMLDLDKKHAFEYELVQRYQLEIAKLTSKKDTLLELRTAKEITSEEYMTKKNEYINKIKTYEGKITEARQYGNEKFELVENFAEVILRAQEILEGKDIVKKRQLVRSISLNLSFFNGKVKISFKKPFSFFFRRYKTEKAYTMCG